MPVRRTPSSAHAVATPAQAGAQPLVFHRSAIKGRGSDWALAHRFAAEQRLPVDDGWPGSGADHDTADAADAPGQPASSSPQTQITLETASSILSRNQSPDIGFDLSINPYRGCEHGCIYCYARPTHSYLNLSPGIDFETQIIAKVNAADLLRRAFANPKYLPQMLNLGSVTDAYQPAERRLRITREVVEVLSQHRHAFSIITKSALVERDLDLIAPMAAENRVAVYVSLTTLDAHLAAILEPRAAAPHRRLRTIETLSRAGVPVGVSVSPMIPFINEPELERLLQAAAEAGARSAFSVVLRLPWELGPLFQQWLATHYPQRAARVMARVRDMREGKLNDARFGTRMTGTGVWAELLRQRFRKACLRLGLNQERRALDLQGFTRPAAAVSRPSMPAQAELF